MCGNWAEPLSGLPLLSSIINHPVSSRYRTVQSYTNFVHLFVPLLLFRDVELFMSRFQYIY